jgi:hypothetical protein
MALFLFTVAAVWMRHESDLDYDLPQGAPPPIPSLAPRCYHLWVQTPQFTRSLPLSVHLSPHLVHDYGLYGRWYRAIIADSDSDEVDLWRPAGSDSLDLILPGWPFGFRFRIPVTDLDAVGRARTSSDAGGGSVGTIRLRRIPCSGSNPGS